MGVSNAMRAGDVMLVTGLTKKSELLALSQKAIYQNAKSSHVLLGLGDGTFIHSTGDGGVHLRFLLDELVEVREMWRVIRATSITAEAADRVTRAGLNLLRQGYNKAFFGTESDSASFCSELVAKAFRDAGVNVLGDTRPSAVTPAYFDRIADAGVNWKDVSQTYRECLPELKRDEKMYRHGFDTINLALAQRHAQSAARATILDLLIETAPEERKTEMENFVEEQKRNLQENRVLTFWDETDSQ